MPMAAPALASLAPLVFVWTWNDLVGSEGQGQELLAAGAVISLALPVAIFFALQRFFVRGVVAGAVKG
jgi:alpha-glucoside transport system permease protein